MNITCCNPLFSKLSVILSYFRAQNFFPKENYSVDKTTFAQNFMNFSFVFGIVFGVLFLIP